VLEEKAVSLFQLEGRDLPSFAVVPKVFNGHPSNDELIVKKNIPLTLDPGLHLYITSKYCIDAVSGANPKSLWAAGTKTMKDLASLGYWVNATADAIGDAEIRSLRASRAVAMMTDTTKPLIVLSNDEAKSTLAEAEVLACYKREINPLVSAEFKAQILKTEVFYWTSFFQYEAYVKHFPEIKDRMHACGVGKTFDLFNKFNIPVHPMAGMEEFKTWTQS
jgi:hydroxymethylbilane synthase